MGWSVHDQQCVKFLAPSAFLSWGALGTKQSTWSYQSRWKPGGIAPWCQRVTTLANKQDQAIETIQTNPCITYIANKCVDHA